MAERGATLEELRAVREALEDVNATMTRQIEERVAEVTVPREEFNRRIRRSGMRVALALVAVVALAAFLVAFNRTTLQQAQRQAEGDLRRLVQVCRTTTPTISEADLAYCNSRVPGFTEARKRAASTAATAAQNEQRLRHLEAQVAELRRNRP